LLLNGTFEINSKSLSDKAVSSVVSFRVLSKKHTDTKQSNKRNNQDSKDKRQDYNMK